MKEAFEIIHKWKVCGNKIASTRKGAQRRAKNQRRKGNLSFIHYECSYCKNWHIGHKSKLEIEVSK